MIVLDSSVLSLVLRRKRPAGPLAAQFARLVDRDARLSIPGVVLQETLSGVRSADQFRRLQRALEGFPILLANEADHVQAAHISNACRGRGLITSNVDCLIAALTIRQAAELWTLDQDFERIAGHCELKLFSPLR